MILSEKNDFLYLFVVNGLENCLEKLIAFSQGTNSCAKRAVMSLSEHIVHLDQEPSSEKINSKNQR